MKSISPLIKPYFIEKRASVITGVIALVVVDLLQVTIPRIIKKAVDHVALFTIDTGLLLQYALMIVFIAILIGMFRYIWRHTLIGTSRRVEEGLRNRLFGHLQTLSADFFLHHKTGDLMARATNDINSIRMATGMGLVALTDAVFLGSAAVGFMLYISWELTLLVLIPAPLIIFGTRFFSRKMHNRYLSVQATFASLTEAMREQFAGIRVIKSYASERGASTIVEAVSKEYIRSNIKLVAITGAFFPMMMLFSKVSLAIVLYVGGRKTIFSEITPGDFVAFISYLGLLSWPMMAMGWVTNLIQRGKASLSRVEAILSINPLIKDLPNATAVKNIHGSFRIENLSFAYPPASPEEKTPNVLENINLTIPSGQTVGIVGPPGSGKSTLARLMTRVFDASEGSIFLDGHDIRQIRLGDLRKGVSSVSQTPFLFGGTIRDNITFGRMDIECASIDEAIQRAALTETIQNFPNGIDTVVGEKGIMLSGGQKQRVALARAFLHPTRVLILDDPISQVDVETGRSLIGAIRDMAGSHTIIIISHRLSAVSFADQIITIQSGKIKESGTHEVLLKQNKYYSRMYRLQQVEEVQYAR